MKFSLLIIFQLAVILATQAQLAIKGTVLDKAKNPIPFANVALYNQSDSVLITGDVTDIQGKFNIPVKQGQYYLKITFLSYQDKTLSGITITDQDYQTGVLVLDEAEALLEAIVVQGEKSTMQLQLDKRVFNVGKDLTNISGSASDILNNVPSVNVDVEGNVSLRGSQNVRILIDGKPSGLTGISTADALRQVQANLIESVEVITNPSSRYDAEGEVGIINIILKKEFRKGVNAAFTVNTGYPANHGGSFNVNFRREKVNFFTSYGFNYREGPGNGSSYQLFTLPDTTFAYLQDNQRVRGGTSHNFIGGMDYFINSKSTLTGSFIYRRSDGLNTAQVEFRDLDSENQVMRSVIRNEREEEPENNAEVSLSFRKEFEQEGKLLTADVKWIENVEREISSYDETDFSTNEITYQRANNTENERNVFLQADYVSPFSKKGKFETGMRSTLRVIDNDFLVEEQNESAEWEALPNFDNSMIYTENIYAAYAMVSNEKNRFSYQAGLRGELTDISIALKQASETSYQTYFNLFPSTHLSYQLKNENTLQLSYSYRLSRPRFRQLLPFSNFTNNRSLSTGNPNLRPEFTHSIEAAYLSNWEAGSILSSVYYRKRSGVIEDITVVDSVGFNRNFPINLATENAYGIEFNFTWNPAKWIRYTANANFYRAITAGEFEEQVFSRDTYTWTGRSIAQFTFFKKYDFQTTFNYRAPQNTPQGKSLSLYSLDLALARDLFKGNGTLAFSVRDLFNTRRSRREVISPEFYSRTDFQWRARQFMLTFTYRLNQKKNTPDKEDFEEGGEFN